MNTYPELLLLTLTFGLGLLQFEGQGQMIPVGEVKTHPPSPRSSHKEKAGVHVKIVESASDQLDDKQNVGDKVSRIDKPEEFQNPAKHASESNLLNFLLEQYSTFEEAGNVASQVEILENLEHFSHKFENGRDLFQSTQALSSILLPALNSSSSEIRRGACGVFGVAAQNNDLVQRMAVEGGVVRRLLHLVTFDTGVRPRAIFALSSLLRNYLAGQQKFIQDGGVGILVDVGFSFETRRKALTFILDLLHERELCNGDSLDLGDPEGPCDRTDLLLKELKKNRWCELLVDSSRNLLEVNLGDEDKTLIIDAVNSSLSICVEVFAGSSSDFLKLLSQFDGEVVLESLQNIIERLKAVESQRDEL